MNIYINAFYNTNKLGAYRFNDVYKVRLNEEMNSQWMIEIIKVKFLKKKSKYIFNFLRTTISSKLVKNKSICNYK